MSENVAETPTTATEPANGQVIETQVIEAPPVVDPQPEPEKVYSYQPTDDQGRPFGALQVFKYRTVEELTQKLTDQNVHLNRALREQTKNNRLGISDTENIPQEAPKFDTLVEFKPRQLSAEERVQLSRDLLDPERFTEATNSFFEATVGVKPETLRQTLSSVQENNLKIQAKIESDAFVADTPEYYRCLDNFKSITNYMLKNDLAPVRGNFKLAYNKLKDVLVKDPASQPAPVVQSPTTNEPPPAPPTPAPQRVVSRVPTGLTREQAADAGPAQQANSVAQQIVYEEPVKENGKLTGKVTRYYGLAAIDRMSSEEFRRRVKADPQFNSRYEQLLKEEEQKKQQRRVSA